MDITEITNILKRGAVSSLVSIQVHEAKLLEMEHLTDVRRIIYILGLEPRTTKDDIERAFINCGPAWRVSITDNPFSVGSTKEKMGYVEFLSREAAQTAMGLNGFLMYGRPIHIIPAETQLIIKTEVQPKMERKYSGRGKQNCVRKTNFKKKTPKNNYQHVKNNSLYYTGVTHRSSFSNNSNRRY